MGKIKILLATVAVSAMSVAVVAPPAEARPSTRSYTCGQLKDLIRKRGAVVMNYKGNSVYKRFVHSYAYCRRPANTVKRYRVQSKSGSCSLNICYEMDFFRD